MSFLNSLNEYDGITIRQKFVKQLEIKFQQSSVRVYLLSYKTLFTGCCTAREMRGGDNIKMTHNIEIDSTHRKKGVVMYS